MFLLFGAVIHEIVRADAVHSLAEAAQTTAPQLLVNHRFVAKIAADAPVGGADIGTQQSHDTRFAPNVLADILLFAPLGIVGNHLRIDETRYGFAKDRQLFIHPGRYVSVDAGSTGGIAIILRGQSEPPSENLAFKPPQKARPLPFHRRRTW